MNLQSLAHELSEADKQKMLLEAQKNIDEVLTSTWKQKKEIISAWAQNLEVIYTLDGKPLNTIANDIVAKLREQGVGYGSGRCTYVFDVLPVKYKQSRLVPTKEDFEIEIKPKITKYPKRRAKHSRARLELIYRLRPICRRCGFTDMRALQIDHIDGGGTQEIKFFQFKRKSMWKYYLQHPDLARERLQVLCANCNWIKRHENRECRKK